MDTLVRIEEKDEQGTTYLVGVYECADCGEEYPITRGNCRCRDDYDDLPF